MNPQLLPIQIGPMKPPDIPEVMAIDQLSFTMPWPHRAYDYELQENQLAHYFVLRTSLETPAQIIGLGGFWLMADEIHITTIAIHPAWRRLGLGEWMLLTLIEQGQTLGAATVTLEVRPSNQGALPLYQKYNFQEVGRRPGYYSDNDEDALILTAPPLTSPDYQAVLRRYRAMLYQRLAQINVDKIEQIG